MDWQPFFLSFKLASTTALLLFAICLPLAFWLAWQKNHLLKSVVLSLANMPLILPPSVLGFYCLVAFKPDGWLGSFAAKFFDLSLIFSFEGLVLASLIYSFPFMFAALYGGIISTPRNLTESSASLGKTKTQTSLRIILPTIKPALASGIILSFAHTMGEFGVILMIGGNIPNETNVVSVAIFSEVEQLNYAAANDYALVLLCASFLAVFCVHLFTKNKYQALS